MKKGQGPERGRSAKRSFADIVREVQSSQAPEPEKRRPGLWGRAFVDKAGREYELVSQTITPQRALDAARAGARVVWDSCGCGGGCGWDWGAAEDVTSMVKSGLPTISSSTSADAWISEFRSVDGTVLLVAQGSVCWGDRLA